MRCFAKLVTIGDDWGINILMFHEEQKSVEQFAHPGGGQSADYTDFLCEEATGKVVFVVNGDIETCCDMREISHELAAIMTSPRNWRNLCYGLGNKSKRTLEWLRQKGIA